MSVAPPRPKTLPLTALRAFEAAGRLGGFAAAAEELGVTPGAVAAQVKALEQAVDAPLFERSAKGVALTALGARALSPFTQAFDALDAATRALREEAAPREAHIATLPAIAQLWLAPRLPALREAEPNISISVSALETPPDLKRAPYDICLFHRSTKAAPKSALLAEERIFPVCAPALAKDLEMPEDLLRLPCLSDATWRGDWDLWCAAALPGRKLSPRGPVFSLYALAVEEALKGGGVLIARETLVRPHLASGALAAPFELRLPIDSGLRLWPARPVRPGSAAERVIRWLEANAV